MDRVIVYEGEIPYEEDLLETNRFAMVSIAKLAQAVLGSNTLINGLACTPTAPASMEVQLAPGEIYSLQNLEETNYSSLPADIDHPILKQGLMLDAALFACPAPATAGHSIDYLVQAAYLDADAEPAVLPYYDTNHPDHPYSGPNNSGEAQPTVRKGVCQLSVKAGVAAPSGQQRPPAPDAGYTGLYRITVAHGQTTITEPDIRLTPEAPFITETLTQKISHADGDQRYARKATTLAGYGITDAINTAEKAQPGGVATLDGQGHVPTEQLPAIDLTPTDGSITTPKLADGAVTNPKIADGAVTKDKISGPLYAPVYWVNGQEWIEQGNGDGASTTVNNLALRAWQGIGLGPSIEGQPVPRNEYSHWFNVRTGDMGMRGNLIVAGALTLRYVLHLLSPSDGATRQLIHDGGTIGFAAPGQWLLRVGNDGNVWTPMFGWLSNYFATLATKNELNTKQPAGNYVQTVTGNAIAIGWRDKLDISIDGQYLGFIWTSNNFDPNAKADAAWVNDALNGKADSEWVNNALNGKADSGWVNDALNGKADSGWVNDALNGKADSAWVRNIADAKADKSALNNKADKGELNGKANAGAQCQYDSEIWDFGRMGGNETQKVQDLPNPWVVTGLNAAWLTDDRLHGIGMRARKLRNQ